MKPPPCKHRRGTGFILLEAGDQEVQMQTVRVFLTAMTPATAYDHASLKPLYGHHQDSQSLQPSRKGWRSFGPRGTDFKMQFE